MQADTLNAILRETLDNHAPLVTRAVRSCRNAQRFNTQVKEAKRERRAAERKWNKTGLHVHREIFISARNRFNSVVCSVERQHYLSKLSSAVSCKELFRVTDELLGKTSGSPSTTQDQGPSSFFNFFTSKVCKIRENLIGSNGDVQHPSFADERERTLHKFGYQTHKVNQLVSDKIPLRREITLNIPECQKFVDTIRPEDLPAASFVIPIHNEIWSTLIRTIFSILDAGPYHLIKEIVIVDDASTNADLGAPLDHYISIFGSKVKLVRLPERSGLIRARLHGVDHTTGDVVVILDAHCEVHQELSNDLKAIAIKHSPNDTSTSLVEKYNATPEKLLEKHAPLKARTSAPWINADVKLQKQQQRQAERAWRKEKTTVKRQIYQYYHKRVKKAINNAKRDYYRSKFWKKLFLNN
ncbi:polypeptide N-acetylgalactosaminyltransferase [Elysia marginata]|uniref:Polypeptide N-acetylgalactosaminyltransferase n=1 Tax=Elysia marginata TaxID=1093978 RepID=A0AAV4JX05_9GAST|nr:polypeptide N-acetylgalactosaminyltransferase [Elysia marginata]